MKVLNPSKESLRDAIKKLGGHLVTSMPLDNVYLNHCRYLKIVILIKWQFLNISQGFNCKSCQWGTGWMWSCEQTPWRWVSVHLLQHSWKGCNLAYLATTHSLQGVQIIQHCMPVNNEVCGWPKVFHDCGKERHDDSLQVLCLKEVCSPSRQIMTNLSKCQLA